MEFYLRLGVIIVTAVLVPFLFHLSSKLNSNKSKTQSIQDVYECGISTPIKDSDETFNVKYYLVAIIFVLFDVEVLFMFPWGVNVRTLSWFGIAEMFTFMGILVAGLIYIYNTKALKWG